MSLAAGGQDKPATGVAVPKRRRVKRNRDDLSFLPAALEIIETPASPAGRATAMTIVAAAVFAIAWAAIGKVDIVVTSQGRIEPVGNSKIVQPFAAGVVQAILVQDDQKVMAGQPLILIDPTDAKADLARSAYELMQGRLDHARLASLRAAMVAGGAVPVLADMPADATREQREATEAAMRAQYEAQVAKLANLDQQIAQAAEKQCETAATLTQLQATIDYATQMATVRDKALSLGVGSKIDWITANQQLSQQRDQVAVLKMQEVEAASAQKALVAQRAQAVADYETSVLGDLVKADEQVDQSQQDVGKAQTELRLTTLRAPISGTVQELTIHTVGGVVTPAQQLLVVVPEDPKLTADVRIENRDIGFVHVGQVVQLKVAAYDFTRYGTVSGVVTGISQDVEGAMPLNAPNQAALKAEPSSVDPNNGQTAAQQDAEAGTYIAAVELSQTSLTTENGRVPLTPGLEVTADIKTGRRSVLSYLLSPIVTLKTDAMRH